LTVGNSLLSIIAYARSGALDHAWRLFREAGFDRIDNDPAVLSVRGRLLKDSALGASGEERKKRYLEAADAYARAAEIGGATYPLINAATLSLLAGRAEQARKLAQRVLERIAQGGDEPETPYYRAATEAEALLVLGRVTKAQEALSAAIALAPQAFEDHASTLRQFGLILRALGRDESWLNKMRPPRSLHFAGHMMLAADDAALAARIREVIGSERIGFGFGALAAGADILIAEALLEAGAELHIVLPAPVFRFREISVARFGESWLARFDRLREGARSIRSIEAVTDPLSPLALRLAAEIAMGKAAMQADTLMTEALQLLIVDQDASAKPAGGSGWIGETWENGGRRQHVLPAQRVLPPKPVLASVADPSDCLAAMLRIELGAETVSEALANLAHILAQAPQPVVPPRWTGEALLVAFDTTSQAAEVALLAAQTLGDAQALRIAGHYAPARRASDPFSGSSFLVGRAPAQLAAIAGTTPSGAIHVSEDFAATLHINSRVIGRRTEYVGELPETDREEPLQLFCLKR